MFDRILVPTDGGDVARNAADSAVRLAARFDATLHVLHVLELGELPPGFQDVEHVERGVEASGESDGAVGGGARDVTAVGRDGNSVELSRGGVCRPRV